MTVVDAPVTDDVDTSDPEKVAHIVKQSEPGNNIAEAIVEGREVTALCGHRFIPYRRPENFPVCPPCRTILENTP